MKNMMTKQWEKLLKIAEHNKDIVMEAAETIWSSPEIGYKEWKTGAYMEKQFEALGYSLNRAGNIPGFTAEKDTGIPGPVIAVLGELDSLICEAHPDADPETRAVHACGHNCQSAYLLGLAAVFASEGALEGMCGKIRFVSVPAEETIDLEYRGRLIREKTIKYLAGKIEFLYRGYLDGVDMAVMMHADTKGPHLIEVFGGSDGCVTKHIEFEGKAAHAGVAPWEGINALYAASLGLQACNALRETFKEEDYVRFHPIMTQAGAAANAIPELAKMDAYCRASNVEAMLSANRRINRALSGAAAALGANVHIVDKPGNLPLHNNEELNALFAETAETVFGGGSILYGPWQTGSCDMGDLSSVMPVCQPMVTGAAGSIHGADFSMGDMDKSCMNPVRLMSLVLYELLKDGGEKAKRIKANYVPVYSSKEEYFEAVDAIAADFRGAAYQADGSIILKLPENGR